MASKHVTRKPKDDAKALKTPKSMKVPKAPKAEKASGVTADDNSEWGFHVVLDPESHVRLEMLIALEVIARAGFQPPKPGEGSRKKIELSDARKSALKAATEQLKREIKYVRKFL